MKRIITTFGLILALSLSLFAQKMPTGIKYQAVARDAQGQIISEKDISLEITLNNDAAEGKTAYSEVHYVKTNVLGLFDLVIGEGESKAGSLEEVPWSTSEIWMNISIDMEAGEDFQLISSSRLLAVPYAMHAGSAGQVLDENGQEKNSFYWKTFGNSGTNLLNAFVGSIDAKDLAFRTSNIERMRITAGGETNIVGNLDIGTDLGVGNDATIGNDLMVGNNFSVVGTGTFGDLTVKNSVNLNTDGSNTTVNGPAILRSTLGVDGASNLNSSLTVAGATNLNSTLGVSGATTLNSTLNVSGTTTSGGKLTVNNTSALNGQVTISAPITGGSDSDFSQYPLQITGGDHGIAIRANGDIGSIFSAGGLGRGTNFLTCFDAQSDPLGRIEGFHANLDLVNVGRSVINAALPRTADGSLSINDAATEVTSDISNLISAFNSDYGVGIISGTLDLVSSIIQGILSIPGCVVIIGCDDLAAATVDILASGIQLGIHFAYFQINPGVAFESGGADYAEWLPKADANEMLVYGDVVGVKGGVVSKEFTEAEKFMIISANPTVIGAMPETGNENAYSKIAFMGQVPVKVIGKVDKGDYILPSGNGDGYAIAVKPDAMKTDDYTRIIGIAWGESDGKEFFSYVNTAVGINTNDIARVVEQMQVVMNEMQLAIQQVNPDYTPSLYDVDQNIQIASSYTTGPTLNQYKNQAYNYQSFGEVKSAINDMWAENTSNGLDMNRFPYILEILENPEDEQLRQAALEYYTAAQTRLQDMLAQIQQGN